MRAAIVNPAAGSGRTAARWRSIVAALESGGGTPIEVQLTRGPGDGIDIVRRLVADGCRDFVVLGGDGTVGEVVAGCVRADGSGVLRDDLELAVVHQGTGGDLARGLGIPKDEGDAIEVALHGDRRRIDVGVATYEPADGHGATRTRGFVSTANVGMAAEVVQRVTGRLKRLGNNGAFTAATVACLARNRPRPVLLKTTDGTAAAIDVVDVSMCNNRYMGGGMLVAPDARIDDGELDVVVIGAAGRARLLRTFPKIYSGRHVEDSLVRVIRTEAVTIAAQDSAEEQGVVLDGELVGRTPATFRAIPSALSVRVPRVER